MENTHLKESWYTRSAKFHVYLIAIISLLFCKAANANSHPHGFSRYNVRERIDTAAEKKVDYIEKIYFSGKNKDGLTTMILTTYQSLEGKPATTAVAKQYIFLTNIKDRANAAKNSCEVEELLAVGIWDIDANEAMQQKIPKPGQAATDGAVDAISKISSLSSSTSNLAGNAALSTWNLSGGSYSAFSGISRVGGTLSTVGSVAGTVGQGKQIADQVGKWMHHDKPCNSVTPKNIEIGPHLLPDTSKNKQQNAGTKIIIKNIKYNQVSSVASAFEKIPGVTSVNSDQFNDNTSTLVLVQNMKIKDLIDKILQIKSDINLNIEGSSANSATFSIK